MVERMQSLVLVLSTFSLLFALAYCCFRTRSSGEQVRYSESRICLRAGCSQPQPTPCRSKDDVLRPDRVGRNAPVWCERSKNARRSTRKR
jgi:hypothetical protein